MKQGQLLQRLMVKGYLRKRRPIREGQGRGFVPTVYMQKKKTVLLAIV